MNKVIDDKIVMDIIESAVNVASGGLVEHITKIAPDKMMTSEQVQALNLTKELLIDAFLQDPRVISAECRQGKFQIVTEEGTITFNFVFGDEGEGPRFMIEDRSVKQETDTTSEASPEEIAEALFDLCDNGVTVEDLIEAFLEDPCVSSAEYKDGRFNFQTTEGPITFWFPFLSRRSKEEKKEDNDE